MSDASNNSYGSLRFHRADIQGRRRYDMLRRLGWIVSTNHFTLRGQSELLLNAPHQALLGIYNLHANPRDHRDLSIIRGELDCGQHPDTSHAEISTSSMGQTYRLRVLDVTPRPLYYPSSLSLLNHSGLRNYHRICIEAPGRRGSTDVEVVEVSVVEMDHCSSSNSPSSASAFSSLSLFGSSCTASWTSPVSLAPL